MKVWQLIVELQQFDPDKEVLYVDDEHGLMTVNTVRTSGKAVVLEENPSK